MEAAGIEPEGGPAVIVHTEEADEIDGFCIRAGDRVGFLRDRTFDHLLDKRERLRRLVFSESFEIDGTTYPAPKGDE